MPQGITKPQLFGELNEEENPMPHKSCPPKGQTQLAVVAATLLLCKLEPGENIAIYNPQTVLRQFGRIRGSPDISCSVAV